MKAYQNPQMELLLPEQNDVIRTSVSLGLFDEDSEDILDIR